MELPRLSSWHITATLGEEDMILRQSLLLTEPFIQESFFLQAYNEIEHGARRSSFATQRAQRFFLNSHSSPGGQALVPGHFPRLRSFDHTAAATSRNDTMTRAQLHSRVQQLGHACTIPNDDPCAQSVVASKYHASVECLFRGVLPPLLTTLHAALHHDVLELRYIDDVPFSEVMGQRAEQSLPNVSTWTISTLIRLGTIDSTHWVLSGKGSLTNTTSRSKHLIAFLHSSNNGKSCLPSRHCVSIWNCSPSPLAAGSRLELGRFAPANISQHSHGGRRYYHTQKKYCIRRSGERIVLNCNLQPSSNLSSTCRRLESSNGPQPPWTRPSAVNRSRQSSSRCCFTVLCCPRRSQVPS